MQISGFLNEKFLLKLLVLLRYRKQNLCLRNIAEIIRMFRI